MDIFIRLIPFLADRLVKGGENILLVILAQKTKHGMQV